MSSYAFVLRFFQDKNFHGGGEKVFFKLIKYLASKGHKIDVYCTKTNADTIENVNVIIVNAPYNHEKPDVMEKFYDAVKNILKDKKYDRIISENFSPPLDITFIHGHSIKYRMNFKPLFLKLLYNFRKVKVERMASEKRWMEEGYNKIFAVSQIQKQDFTDNLNAPENIITVLPLAHDGMKEFKDKIYSKDSSLTFGASMIGFARKGGYALIDALKYLKEFDYKVKIIYPKWKKNYYLRFLIFLYGLKKHVEFIEFQQSMEDFYNDIDVMLIPSREDSFNLTTLEAMAYGIVPVVSTRTGSCGILKDKFDGYIFKYDKEAGKNLACVLKEILSDPSVLNDIKKNAYETAKQYQWQNMCEKFEAEIK